MIVKVQRSIVTSHPTQMCLVYNKDRSLEQEFELTPEMEEIFGDRLKYYCEASEDDDGALLLIGEVDAPDW